MQLMNAIWRVAPSLVTKLHLCGIIMSFSLSYPTTNTFPSPPSFVDRSLTSMPVNVPNAVPKRFLVATVDARLI